MAIVLVSPTAFYFLCVGSVISTMAPIFRRHAASCIVSPSLFKPIALGNLLFVTTLGRPPLRTCAAAAYKLALVRSLIRSRSNCPITPTI